MAFSHVVKAHGAVVLMIIVGVLAIAQPAQADTPLPVIEGSGSSWAANAANQWVADLSGLGLRSVYTASGSGQGRTDYANSNVDFAITDLPYASGTAPTRQFGYAPIVGGGVAFPFHLEVNGQFDRDLRLSGRTLALIFTNQITDWSDPAITADNKGVALPSLPIIPVVDSGPSATSAVFTGYLASQFPSIWTPYFGSSGSTSAYPKSGATMVSQNGSNGVMNFVDSSVANGAIGITQYSYALYANYPVAKVENAAGYYVLPTQYNVSIALTHDVVDTNPASPTYLQQNLAPVYSDADQRTYPLSSYSYALLPIGATDTRMNASKRQAMVDFVFYAVCSGQRAMGALGYAPLPYNLVAAALTQVQKVGAVVPGVDTSFATPSSCQSPTFVAAHPDNDYLQTIAPFPPACDQSGAGPCSTGPTSGPVGGIPLSATDNSVPYAGQLTLAVGGSPIDLTQLDPTSPGGRPAQATDPTGHRHAWVFQGVLNGIAVVDTRPTQPGWSLTADASDFTGPVDVPASDLGWSPFLTVPGTDADGTVTPGVQVPSALAASGTDGLSVIRTLSSAAPGNGLGTAQVGASLTLWIPDTSPPGGYTSTLTLTLVGP